MPTSLAGAARGPPEGDTPPAAAPSPALLASILAGSPADLARVFACVALSHSSGAAGLRRLAAEDVPFVVEFCKSVQAMVQRQRRQQQIAASAEAASTRAQRSFLASMSHELRTPLNAVVGMLNLALMEEARLAARGSLPPLC